MARLPAVRFRLHPDDHARYGDQWFTFDEADLTRLRARELAALDDALRDGLGLNVVTALSAYHRGETRGALAVMWMARRLAGVDEDEDLADFDPLPMLAETIVQPLPTASRRELMQRRERLAQELEQLDARLALATEDSAPAGDAVPPDSTSSTSPASSEE